MRVSQYFKLSEFRCKDGNDVPGYLMQNVQELAANLDVLRVYLGKPIYISSGYRTEKHNRAIGGRPNSYHLRAMAADIRVKGVRPVDVVAAIEHLIATGKMEQGGLGVYKTFVHYDIRGEKARWKG